MRISVRGPLPAVRAKSCVSRVLAVQNHVLAPMVCLLPAGSSLMFVMTVLTLALGKPLPDLNFWTQKIPGMLVGGLIGVIASKPIYQMLGQANRDIMRHQLHRPSLTLQIGEPGKPISTARSCMNHTGLWLKRFAIFAMALATSSFFADFFKITSDRFHDMLLDGDKPQAWAAFDSVVMVVMYLINVPNFIDKIAKNIERIQVMRTLRQPKPFVDQQLKLLAQLSAATAATDTQRKYDTGQQAIAAMRGELLANHVELAQGLHHQKREGYALPLVLYALHMLLYTVIVYPAFVSGRRVAENTLSLSETGLQMAYSLIALVPLYSMEFYLGTSMYAHAQTNRLGRVYTAHAGAEDAAGGQPEQLFTSRELVKTLLVGLVAAASPLFLLINARGDKGFANLGQSLLTGAMLLVMLYGTVLSRMAPPINKKVARHNRPATRVHAYVDGLLGLLQQRDHLLKSSGSDEVVQSQFNAESTAALLGQLEAENVRLDGVLARHR